MRKTACYALGCAGVALDYVKGPDSKALLTLVDRLKDPCGPVRREAIMALSALGKSTKTEEINQEKKALEALVDDKKEHDKGVQIWSRVLLYYLDEKLATEKNLAPIAKYMLEDPDPFIRIDAAKAMGTLG